MIGDSIEVVVVDVRGDKARVGVEAPRDISVHRKEVYEAIKAENQAAAQVATDLGTLAGIPPGLSPSSAGVLPHHNPKQHALTNIPAAVPAALTEDEQGFLAAARQEAQASLQEGGIPVGAVLVKAGQIISRGRNRRAQDNDPTAHAEVDALRKAGVQVDYSDAVLYTTLSPCIMCSGAIVQLGVTKVVIAEAAHSKGAIDWLRQQGVQVKVADDSDCIKMLDQFIRDFPEKWAAGLQRSGTK